MQLPQLLYFIFILPVSILGTFLLLYSCLVLWYRYRYGHLPCPAPVSFFLGHLKVLKNAVDRDGHMYNLLTQWAHEHGSVFVIYNLHKPWVVTWDPAAVKDILITGHFPKSPEVYSKMRSIFGLRFFGNSIETDLNDITWGKKRREYNFAFHISTLKNLLSDFNSATDKLIEELGNFADKNEIIELWPWLHRTTLDVITQVAFGKCVNALGEGSPFHDAMTDVMNSFGENLKDPTLGIPGMGSSKKKKFASSLAYIKDMGRKWINERETAVANDEYVPDDILNRIVRMKDKGLFGEGDDPMDDFILFFVAGHETSAHTISIFMMEAWRHPEVVTRLYEEVDEVLGKKPRISFEDINNLEYLNLVWKETLRLYPIAPFTFRDIDRDGYQIDGHSIPKGTTTLLSSWVSSRMPSLVRNPMEFHPERFLSDSADRPNVYSYFPFSLGPRNCIGRNFAKFEGKVIIAKLLQNFNFTLDPSQSFALHDGGTLRPRDKVRLTLSWRKTT